MSGPAEPEGCNFEWDDHTCLLDLHHEGEHRCMPDCPPHPNPEGLRS